jgi:hypothetical protein
VRRRVGGTVGNVADAVEGSLGRSRAGS